MGYDIDKIDNEGNTAIKYAKEYGYPDIVCLFNIGFFYDTYIETVP